MAAASAQCLYVLCFVLGLHNIRSAQRTGTQSNGGTVDDAVLKAELDGGQQFITACLRQDRPTVADKDPIPSPAGAFRK